jgi:hypothetical protein
MIKNFVFPSVAANAAINGGSIGTSATHIRCTQGNAPFEVRAYSGSELVFYASSWQAGLSAGPMYDMGSGSRQIRYFDRVEVLNGSTAQTIELYIGDGEVLDNRLVGTVAITGGILSRPLGADTLDSAGVTTLAASGAATDTIIKAATSQGVEILIQNLGAVPVVIAQSLTTIGGWTTIAGNATKTGGLVLEPVPAGANVGGSATLSAGMITRGVGIGGTAIVTWTASKFA